MEENTARLLQLEEDLIGVTQKGLQKETELDWCVDFNAIFIYTAAYCSEKYKMTATTLLYLVCISKASYVVIYLKSNVLISFKLFIFYSKQYRNKM